MPKKYTPEQFWKLYENLPQELKDALFAEETGDNIYEICQRNEIADELEEIVDYVGQVLVGVLPPDDFPETLEKELKLKKEVAKKVAQEIYRFIFYPVKPALEELYKIEIKPPTGMPPVKPVEAREAEIGPPVEEKPEMKPEEARKDIYREPIE